MLGLASWSLGVEDDLLQLGLDSLSALGLAASLRGTNMGDGAPQMTQILRRPTVAGLALAAVTRRRRLSSAPPMGLGLDEDDGRFSDEGARASFGQEQMVVLQATDRSSAAYNVPLMMFIGAAVPVEVVSSAVLVLTTRHQALRTVLFHEPGGGGSLRQRVLREWQPELVVRA